MKNHSSMNPCQVDPKARTAAAKPVKLQPFRKPSAEAPRALLDDARPLPSAFDVTFQYDNLNAAEVFVAGTFNDWQPRATPLNRQIGGRWTTRVSLAPNTYEYLLVVDGQWLEDPAARRSIHNPFGGRNSVVEVPRAKG